MVHTLQLAGLQLDYRGDLSGGGFLIRSQQPLRICACGASFSPAPEPLADGVPATK